jgi:hypothetical protein
MELDNLLSQRQEEQQQYNAIEKQLNEKRRQIIKINQDIINYYKNNPILLYEITAKRVFKDGKPKYKQDYNKHVIMYCSNKQLAEKIGQGTFYYNMNCDYKYSFKERLSNQVKDDYLLKTIDQVPENYPYSAD